MTRTLVWPGLSGGVSGFAPRIGGSRRVEVGLLRAGRGSRRTADHPLLNHGSWAPNALFSRKRVGPLSLEEAEAGGDGCRALRRG